VIGKVASNTVKVLIYPRMEKERTESGAMERKCNGSNDPNVNLA